MADYSGVPDTLFIPLAGRSYVSKRFPEYFRDETALSMEKDLPLDRIMKDSGEYNMLASAARYYKFDRIILDFLSRKGPCNIVNLGAGLETARFHIPSKDIVFYEVDLPDVIDMRRKVLGEQENEVFFAGSAFESAWMEAVDTSRPTMVMASGVFQYFRRDEIISLIKALAEKIPCCEVVFDATNTKGLRYTNKYVKKTGNDDAMMYFAVDDPAEFSSACDASLMSCTGFFEEAREILKKKTSLYTRVAMRICDNGGRVKILHLCLCKLV